MQTYFHCIAGTPNAKHLINGSWGSWCLMQSLARKFARHAFDLCAVLFWDASMHGLKCCFDFLQSCLIEENLLDETADPEAVFHAQVRACMCFSLSNLLSTWSQGGRPLLQPAERKATQRLGVWFLAAYSYLAAKALERRLLLYKLRPKHHYLVHLLEHAAESGMNPMHLSNFLDEDNMKMMRGVAKACHAKTVKHAWARRYILKKVLGWHGSKRCMLICTALGF